MMSWVGDVVMGGCGEMGEMMSSGRGNMSHELMKAGGWLSTCT